jgi:HupE / UreJ protein
MNAQLCRLLAVSLWLLAGLCQAHAPSNATLSLQADGAQVQQRWDIALRDLDRVLPLDANDDGAITWGELRSAWPAIAAQAERGLQLATPGEDGATARDCTAGPLQPPAIETHADGQYVVLQRPWHCAEQASTRGLLLRYRLFADSDASHRGLLQWRPGAAADSRTAVLVPDDTVQVLPGEAAAARAPTGFGGFVAEGVHHILIGTDHLLFLLALLLPAVLPAVKPAPRHWRSVGLQVARVVTAFTVAHSITLALAVLQVVDPPSRWVESLIAASVVLAALDNLRRFLPGVRWQLAFAFGLVHGFGFAGALGELGLEPTARAAALLGFNLGVELGQLAVVALVLPLAWWIRDTLFYRRVLLQGGSLTIAAVAALWLAERALDLSLL